jgi:hypothetical protein
MQSIIENGTFYFPAWKHYESSGPNHNVKCVRCGLDNLSCCIGYQNQDLCMTCANCLAVSIARAKPANPAKPTPFPDKQDNYCTLGPIWIGGYSPNRPPDLGYGSDRSKH